MPYIDKDPENQELSAEMLLTTYFSDVKEWNAVYGSFFARNYSGDLISCDHDTETVSLARNGLYDIMPEKLFFDSEELRFLEKRDLAYKLSETYEEEKNIKIYFKPFDSYFFNQSLRLNKVVTHLVDHKTRLLLKVIFDYDIEAEENPYVKQIAPLLLHVTDLRANLDRIVNILTDVLECRVEYKAMRPEYTQFVVHKRQLDGKSYAMFMKELKPLFAFVKDWFMPMEMELEFKVKDYEQPFVLSDERALVLDYNTQL